MAVQQYQMTREQLVRRLIDTYKTPPRWLNETDREYFQNKVVPHVREGCKEFGIEIPEWAKEK